MSVCLASMIRRPVEMVHDDGFQSADRWFSPQITRSGPAITVSGFLSADSLSLDKRRIIGYHYSLRAGVQASRDIVSQCSCSLHPTSVIPPLQCRSLLPLFRRTGSQPGAILAPPMSVLKLGATDFGGLAQTLLLNVCDARKAQFGQIVPLALACPFGTSQTPHFGVCASPGATRIEGTKRECL